MILVEVALRYNVRYANASRRLVLQNRRTWKSSFSQTIYWTRILQCRDGRITATDATENVSLALNP